MRTLDALPSRSAHRRSGAAAFWILVTVPALLLGLGVAVDIANLWVARVELENALEAAALAAVTQWGESNGGSTEFARQVGVQYAAANTIRSQPLLLNENLLTGDAANPNENASCHLPDGQLIFGSVVSEGQSSFDPALSPYVFDATEAPDCDEERVTAVRAQARVTISSVFSNLFGLPPSVYSVQANTTAVYDCSEPNPTARLIKIINDEAHFICPAP